MFECDYSVSGVTLILRVLKGALRPFVHVLRELKVYTRLFRRRRPGKTIVMFPSDVRQMSAMLRGYNIAEFLELWGWRAVVVPMQLRLPARRRILKAFKPDFIYFQSSRHVLNDPAHFPQERLVYDIDDADFFDEKLTDRIRHTCETAVGLIAGSRFVAQWCSRYHEKVEIIWTGTTPSQMDRPAHDGRAPIITWAQSHPSGYKAEFEFICGLMKKLRQRYDQPFTLRLYGWLKTDDMSPIEDLRAHGVEVELFPFMAYSEFISSLTAVAIGLCPLETGSHFSKGKSFGKILGYLDAKVPVIASDMADHALFFTDQSGVVSDDEGVWLESIIRLLDNPQERQKMADKAYDDFELHLTSHAAARKVEAYLNRLAQDCAIV